MVAEGCVEFGKQFASLLVPQLTNQHVNAYALLRYTCMRTAWDLPLWLLVCWAWALSPQINKHANKHAPELHRHAHGLCVAPASASLLFLGA